MSTGGSQSIGGISAEIELSTGNLDAQLANIQGALMKTAEGMRRWQAEFAAGKISAQQLDAAITPLIAHQDELRASYDRVTQAMAAQATATTHMTTSMAGIATHAERATMGGKNLGMTLMQVGYIVDDLQYSFSAVINNIAPLIASFTGSMGMAAAAQVVGVGVYQLVRHWDDLMEAFGNSRTETEAEEMERLAKATKLTADEEERLGKYRKERADIQRMLEGESKEQKATESAVQDVFNEADPKKVKAFLASQLKQERDAMPLTKAEEDEIRRAGEGAAAQGVGGELGESMVDPLAEERRLRAEQAKRLEIDKRRGDEAAAAAERLMLAAKQEGGAGDAAAARILGFVENPRGPGGVPGGLGNVGAARPGERQAQDALEAHGKVQAEGIAERAKADEKARNDEERADREAEQMKERAREAEKRWRRENVAGAKEAVPGIEEVAERGMLGVRAGEMPPGAVQEQLKAMLAAAGMGGMGVGMAAEDLTAEAGKKVQGDIVHAALNPTRQGTQIFDAAEFASKIQTSVSGGDDTKKIRQVIERLATKWESEQDKTVNLKIKK